MATQSLQQPVPQHASRYRASFIAPTPLRPDSMLRTHPTEQELRQFLQQLMAEADGHQLVALGVDRILALAGWEFVLSCCRMVDHVGRDFCRRAIIGAVGNALLAKRPISLLDTKRHSMFIEAPADTGLAVPTHFMRISSVAGFTERDIHLNGVAINFAIGAYPSTPSADVTQRLMDALIILERRLITEQVVDRPSWPSIGAEQMITIAQYVSDDSFHEVFGQESRITLRDAQIFGVTSQEAANYTGALHFFGNFRRPLEGRLNRDALDAEDYIRVLIVDPAFSLRFACAEAESSTDLPLGLLNLWRDEAWCPSGITFLHDSKKQEPAEKSLDYARMADGPDHWYRPVVRIERRVTGELLTFVVGCSRGSASREDVVTKLYTAAYLALKQQELWLGRRAYKKAEQTPYVYAYLVDRTRIEFFYLTGSRQGRTEMVDYTFDHIHTIDIAASGNCVRANTSYNGLNVGDEQACGQQSSFSMTAVLQACSVFTTMAAYVYERVHTMENGTRGRIYDNFRAEVDKCALLPELEIGRVVHADQLARAHARAAEAKSSMVPPSHEEAKTEAVSAATQTSDAAVSVSMDEAAASRTNACSPRDKLKEKRQKYMSSFASFNSLTLEAMQRKEILSDTASRLSSARGNRKSIVSSRKSIVTIASSKLDGNIEAGGEQEHSLASDNERRQRVLEGMDRLMFAGKKSDTEPSQKKAAASDEKPSTSEEKQETKQEMKQAAAPSIVADTAAIAAAGQADAKTKPAVSDAPSTQPARDSLALPAGTDRQMKMGRRSGIYGKEGLTGSSAPRASLATEAKEVASDAPARQADAPASESPAALSPRPLPIFKNIRDVRQSEHVQVATKPVLRDQILLANARRANVQSAVLPDSAAEDDSTPLATYAIRNRSATANQPVSNEQEAASATTRLGAANTASASSFRHASFAGVGAVNAPPTTKTRASASPLDVFVFPAPPPPLTSAQRKSIIEGADPRVVLGRPAARPTVPSQSSAAVRASTPILHSPMPTHSAVRASGHALRQCTSVVDQIELPELPGRIPRVKTPQDPVQPGSATSSLSASMSPAPSSAKPVANAASMTPAVQRGPPSARQTSLFAHKKGASSNSSLTSFFNNSNNAKSDTALNSSLGSKNNRMPPVKKAGSFRNLRALFR
ncbi:hypothetical protein SYNPS1DRAFT_23129 [Syncephalis pseudoplumigaleata]|uniref:Uncharacterized protein n=1 Tax=Syncephalis pseudoplumigaleata TaxID=1712513 RepID=A0A4P9YZ16_9FUNG|nr:hypothetical protein SYNPS1DRAFT_23129 [Syncephalis pseudoplumigaleata]|eukprot:RKP24822.1 hypothetical protein SYNPS1DRAFT_23129 [Syncephalis pseudoplumigaleata]